MQKKTFLIASIALLVAAVGCSKIAELLTFSLNYTTKISVPPSSSLNLPFDLFTTDITTNSETEFSTRGTNKDHIDEVKLKTMRLAITSPSDQRFDFLSSVEVYMKADGLGELKIAESQAIPDNVGATLDLTVAANDLAPYVKKDKFTLRAKVVSKKATSRQINIDVTSSFDVKAKLL